MNSVNSGHTIKCLLTEFRSGRTGKYLALATRSNAYDPHTAIFPIVLQ